MLEKKNVNRIASIIVTIDYTTSNPSAVSIALAHLTEEVTESRPFFLPVFRLSGITLSISNG